MISPSSINIRIYSLRVFMCLHIKCTPLKTVVILSRPHCFSPKNITLISFL